MASFNPVPLTRALASGSLGLPTALALLVLTGVSPAPARPLPAKEAPIPQIPRDNWKDCSFNDRVIGCQDRELADGVRIEWRDGRSMTYRLIREGFPVSLLRDRYGGLWKREILAQSNGVFTNVTLGKLANDNRIVVPLRLTCKPPLVGEVGYCQRP